MRAAVCRAYGPPEMVTVDDVPSPVLGDGQVRVRISAAAVNFPDVLLVADQYQVTLPVPFVPGSEFVGRVSQVADRVQGLAVGDRVLGTVIAGAFAEEVAVAADVGHAPSRPGSTTITPPPSGWPGGPRTMSSGPWPVCSPATN